MLKFSEIFEFSKETFRKIPILKEFEWFEWFEWFGPSPIEPFNSAADCQDCADCLALHSYDVDGVRKSGRDEEIQHNESKHILHNLLQRAHVVSDADDAAHVGKRLQPDKKGQIRPKRAPAECLQNQYDDSGDESDEGTSEYSTKLTIRATHVSVPYAY